MEPKTVYYENVSPSLTILGSNSKPQTIRKKKESHRKTPLKNSLQLHTILFTSIGN